MEPLNPKSITDIIVGETKVYGYLPEPESSFKGTIMYFHDYYLEIHISRNDKVQGDGRDNLWMCNLDTQNTIFHASHGEGKLYLLDINWKKELQ